MLLAQISDFHVKSGVGAPECVIDTSACLVAAVAALNALEPAPDLVVATGDLVDVPSEAEYAHLRALMAPLRVPFLLLPGNHDAADALRAIFPDHAYLPRQGPLCYVIDDYPVRVVALDTTISGKPGGALGSARLEWLDDRLADAPARPTVVLMHHPPFATGIAAMDQMGLADAAAFAGVAARHAQIERILCGHVHRAIEAAVGGRLAMSAPSTAHQVALDLRPEGTFAFTLEPPGFRLHLWRDGRMTSHTRDVGGFPPPFPFAEAGRRIG